MDAALIIAICITLSLLAYYKGLLNMSGSIMTMIFGIIIGLAGGITWILLLFVFLITSFAATRYKFNVKVKKGIQEGTRGERSWANVVANGIVPLIIAVLTLDNLPFQGLDKTTGSILFLCAVAIAAADTLASELGVLSKKTWLITNMKPVKAGIDGGISLPGQASAASAAAYTAIIGYLVFTIIDGLTLNWLHIILVIDIGFLGCQIDSVIGATIETKGYVSKLTNNLLSITSGTIIAWLVMIWIL